MDFGINPSDLTIVIPSKDNKGKFIILEGNRRLAAIQLLSDPTLASMGYDTKHVNLLKMQGERYKKSPINKLLCVVFNQRDEAYHWIELRHTGENQGRGVVSWGAKEKARFNRYFYERRRKGYKYKGFLQQIAGQKLSPGCVIVPYLYKKKIIKVFSKYKIEYEQLKVWK